MEDRNCSKCGENKDIDEFPFRNKAKGIRQNQCRSCVSAVSNSHYTRNKKYYLAKNKRLIMQNYLRVIEHLISHPCIDCCNDDIEVLQFDHLHDKECEVSVMISKGCGWDKIAAEIEKCVVRCANCHIKRTRKQFSIYSRDIIRIREEISKIEYHKRI